MEQYGQNIIWSTATAVKPFSGIAEGYTYRDAYQEQLIEGESGDSEALILRLRKGDIRFNATVTDQSTDFPDLSAGPKITISGINTGTVLCREAVEKWQRGQAKDISISATHYPSITGGSAVVADTLDAVTPTQSGLIIRPEGKVIWSTRGLTHASGIVESLTLTQKWDFQEIDDGVDYISCVAKGFERRIALEVMAVGNSDVPALNSELVVTGAPDHAGSMIIVNADKKWAKGNVKMFSVEALWIAALATP